MSVDEVALPQPYFIPGYTGFCPQFKYRSGHTFGSTTHKLLLDPTISHADHLVLSGRSIDDYQVVRPPKIDIEVVEDRFKHGDPVYQHRMVPSSSYDGLNGHIPFGYDEFGKAHEEMTNSALCNFSSNYRQRQSTQGAPVTIARPDPPLVLQLQPAVIYHRDSGMLPNYSGHIPGEMFRFGHTFGNDTIDAKRWLRGDYRA